MGNLDRKSPSSTAQPTHAVTTIVERIMAEPGHITLVTLGPVSNIALALLMEPNVARCVKHIYMMGGVVNALVNVAPSAASNVWDDPEAAQILLQSGAPLTMIGGELVWGEMVLTGDEMTRLRTSPSRYATLAIERSRAVASVTEQILGYPALALADPIAMAVAMDVSLCRTKSLYVAVETTSDLTHGETVVDEWGVMGQAPNVQVCFDPDAQQYKQLLWKLLQVE